MYEDVSLDDLQVLFKEQVIRYKKIPVLVKAVSEARELFVSLLDAKKDEKVPLSSPDLDFSPVPLGMCNFEGMAFHLSRKPSRQYGLGLNKGNLFIRGINRDDLDHVGPLLKFRHESILSCILGKYPTFIECCTAIMNKEASSIAFSREWALDENLALYYRVERAGTVNEENGEIVLDNHKKFLKEVLHAY